MRTQICTYCGTNPGTTKDHVPPKGLFAKPRPNLITVPCCEDCRINQSLDDEYFVRMIALKHDVANNLSANSARDAVLRSLHKPNKRRFTHALFRAITEVEVHTKSGLYLGQMMSYNVDLKRLCRVIERTMRGLYWHNFGERLSDNHTCRVYALDGFNGVDLQISSELQRLWEHTLSGEKQELGETVFTYWVKKIDGPENATLWNFLIYGAVPFIAFTGPRVDFDIQSLGTATTN